MIFLEYKDRKAVIARFDGHRHELEIVRTLCEARGWSILHIDHRHDVAGIRGTRIVVGMSPVLAALAELQRLAEDAGLYAREDARTGEGGTDALSEGARQ